MPKVIPESKEEQGLERRMLGDPVWSKRKEAVAGLGQLGLGWQLYGPYKSSRHGRAHPWSNDPCCNEGSCPLQGN